MPETTLTVAVTGGSGFVGSQVIDHHLKKGDTVRCLSRRGRSDVSVSGDVCLFQGDLGDPAYDSAAFVSGADILYHCAGEIRDPKRMAAVHVGGTRRLAASAAGRIGRWVQLSSVGVYGGHRNGRITEETAWEPQGEYEETKADSDRILLESGESKDFPVTIIRPSIVFGETMRNGSLQQMVAAIRSGIFFFIGIPGASANYVHVDNVVHALLLAGSSTRNGVSCYNVSDWRTMEDFTSTVSDALGQPAPRRRLPESLVRGMVRLGSAIPKFPLTKSRVDALTSRSVYDTAKIESDLGYKHVVTVEEGLDRCVSAWTGSREGK